MKNILLLITLTSTIFAKGISIEEILQSNFGAETTSQKENLLLTKEEAKTIQQEAKAKLSSKIVRLYTVSDTDGTVGYGVILTKKIRTKKATVLYMIDSNQSIKSIEVVSFKEPLEYKPNQEWEATFNDKNSSDMLISGKDIPTISGATLSARAITDAARIALAIIAHKKP